MPSDFQPHTVREFVRRHCVKGPARRVLLVELYSAYLAWRRLHGPEDPGLSLPAFERRLLVAFPSVKFTRPFQKGGSRSVLGLALKDSA
jgi:hypothetical protein